LDCNPTATLQWLNVGQQKKVINMQTERQNKDHKSPAAELVAPVMFIAGLFALMGLLSAIV
jgi:hypothetical protein